MEWIEDVERKLKRKNMVLFSRDSLLLQELDSMIQQQSHQVLILWAMELAQETVDSLAEKYPTDTRPASALEAARAWAAGSIKMPMAQRAILDCHAMNVADRRGGERTKKRDKRRTQREATALFTYEECIRALQMFAQNKSVKKTIRMSGYPGRQTLYRWIEEQETPPREKSAFRGINTPEPGKSLRRQWPQTVVLTQSGERLLIRTH